MLPHQSKLNPNAAPWAPIDDAEPLPHYNVAVCGHVDAGKSTVCSCMRVCRSVRFACSTTTFYEENLDFNEAENEVSLQRARMAASMTKPKRSFTLREISWRPETQLTTLADLCLLVVSARTGEFECAFDKHGTIREHAELLHACGVPTIICAVNKMDTVAWSEERFMCIRDNLSRYFRAYGFQEGDHTLQFVPISASLAH